MCRRNCGVGDHRPARGDVTVELWVEPQNSTQNTALIFGDSSNTNARNIAIVQSATRLDADVRSTVSNTEGESGTAAANATAAPQLQHVSRRSDRTENGFVP